MAATLADGTRIVTWQDARALGDRMRREHVGSAMDLHCPITGRNQTGLRRAWHAGVSAAGCQEYGCSDLSLPGESYCHKHQWADDPDHPERDS